jgi:peptide/nickel transport system substrate-binding protein
VLGTSGDGYIARMSPVGVDQLRKAGVNVDLQTMDFPTLVRRRESKEPPDKGGWNIYFNIIDGLFNLNPATNSNIRADGRSGLAGWPNSSRLEALREAWLDTAELAEEKRISEQIQLQMWQDVPYIPLGHWVRSTAHRAGPRRSALGLSRLLRRAARLTEYSADRATLPIAALEAE